MNWLCQHCGHDSNMADGSACAACGTERMATRVVLVGDKGSEVAMRITTACGQPLLKSLNETESQFASSPQFEIVRDDEAGIWRITHAATATNPTFLNGRPLLRSETLQADSVISLGPEKMKLVVRLEFSA